MHSNEMWVEYPVFCLQNMISSTVDIKDLLLFLKHFKNELSE